MDKMERKTRDWGRRLGLLRQKTKMQLEHVMKTRSRLEVEDEDTNWSAGKNGDISRTVLPSLNSRNAWTSARYQVPRSIFFQLLSRTLYALSGRAHVAPFFPVFLIARPFVCCSNMWVNSMCDTMPPSYKYIQDPCWSSASYTNKHTSHNTRTQRLLPAARPAAHSIKVPEPFLPLQRLLEREPLEPRSLLDPLALRARRPLVVVARRDPEPEVGEERAVELRVLVHEDLADDLAENKSGA